ncbi:hypothetical protein ACIPZG_10500 [Pseudomonas sp. NPDC089395]|uniref:hypothetical protein n=1 Tax=Pseudomonas sp. NPDC089395 TaxID=3364460 RepID=UPI0038231A6C
MSNQTLEKEKSLAELMVRILKEPLKPLDKSMADLNGELSDVKKEIEETHSVLSLCLDQAEIAAKQGKQAVQSLRSLRDEQSTWMPTLQAWIAEQAQSGVESVGKQLSSLADRQLAAQEDVLSALSTISHAQGSVAQAMAALPDHLSGALDATNAKVASVAEHLQQLLESQASALAAVRRDALSALAELRLEQANDKASMNEAMASGVAALQSSIAEHAQVGAQAVQSQVRASTEANALALAVVKDDVLSALAQVRVEHGNAVQAIDALPDYLKRELETTNASLASGHQSLEEQIRQSHAALEKGIAQSEADMASMNEAIATRVKGATLQIGQLVVHQQRTFSAAHQAVLTEVANATGRAQATMLQSLQVGQSLGESLDRAFAQLTEKLDQQTALLNARFHRSEAKVKQLTIIMSMSFVSMLAYIAYDLLSKVN